MRGSYKAFMNREIPKRNKSRPATLSGQATSRLSEKSVSYALSLSQVFGVLIFSYHFRASLIFY